MTCYTALITPFDPEGNLDTEGFVFHVNRQIEAGVDGLVILGTTAEAATLTEKEKETLLKLARKNCDLPLMAGCSATTSAQTLENLQKAADLGANSALVCTPAYIKPTQEGVFQYYEAVSKASPLPIVAYNNPGRTVVNIEVETLKRIAKLPNITGIKECSENIAQISDILFTIKKERPDFDVICGDDIMTLPFMALGADGIISGGASVIPHEMVALLKACNDGDFEKARALNHALIPVFKAFRLESSPIPLKAALVVMGLPSGNPRLPLTPLNPKYQNSLTSAVQWLNAIPTF